MDGFAVLLSQRASPTTTVSVSGADSSIQQNTIGDENYTSSPILSAKPRMSSSDNGETLGNGSTNASSSSNPANMSPFQRFARRINMNLPPSPRLPSMPTSLSSNNATPTSAQQSKPSIDVPELSLDNSVQTNTSGNMSHMQKFARRLSNSLVSSPRFSSRTTPSDAAASPNAEQPKPSVNIPELSLNNDASFNGSGNMSPLARFARRILNSPKRMGMSGPNDRSNMSSHDIEKHVRSVIDADMGVD